LRSRIRLSAPDGARFECYLPGLDVGKLSFDQLVSRIKGEYVEMPGLWLTPDQGARLWSLERQQCEELLLTLVKQGFLTARDDGKYGRVTPDSTGGRLQMPGAMLGDSSPGTRQKTRPE
jgi:hypothetical protein